MSALRLAIIGCTGRMGRALIRRASADPAFQVVAAISTPDDPLLDHDAGAIGGIGLLGLPVRAELEVACDVAVEFTLPPGCAAWAERCAAQGVALVSGTTGLSADQRRTLESAAQRVPVVWSANMSIGVNLLADLVQQVARRLGAAWDVEIIERHHRRKVDAPSGTALQLKDAVCGAPPRVASSVALGRAGQIGARPANEVGIHAVRMGGVIGEHEVCFASEDEIVTLSHSARSRDTFATGALRAAAWAARRPPGLYSMRDVLANPT